MPRTLKFAWWIALSLIAIGLAPVAIAILGSPFVPALGPIGYLGMVTLPLSLLGACLLPLLALWTLVVWWRGRERV